MIFFIDISEDVFDKFSRFLSTSPYEYNLRKIICKQYLSHDLYDKSMLENEEFRISDMDSDQEHNIINIDSIESLMYLCNNCSCNNIAVQSYPCSYKGTYCIIDGEKIGWQLAFDSAIEWAGDPKVPE